ncbi:hypothetical protein [Saccharopolyspora hattusasensis]|uniref:hypothetical protein n=1 Tax=Saccharopolyspora hattusasensis TaxID=1128679 RepID=UPI003D9977E5
MIAYDFMHLDTAIGQRLYAQAFLEHTTRRLHIACVTARPTSDRVTQQARNVTAGLGVRVQSLRFLLRDRDAKYTNAFEAIIEAEDMEILKSPGHPRRTLTAKESSAASAARFCWVALWMRTYRSVSGIDGEHVPRAWCAAAR